MSGEGKKFWGRNQAYFYYVYDFNSPRPHFLRSDKVRLIISTFHVPNLSLPCDYVIRKAAK